MKYVLDPNVAAKWVLPEIDSPARLLLDGTAKLNREAASITAADAVSDSSASDSGNRINLVGDFRFSFLGLDGLGGRDRGQSARGT